jgi:hypothetical protein
MLLEAVTVCVRYDDFLAVSAAHNRGLFDRWVIVTTPEDLATREVCRRFNLEVLLSEEGTRNGAFEKGCLIERGLKQLSANGWRVHLDADIVLPPNLRYALRQADLDESCLYGVDRILVKSWAEWLELLSAGYLATQHDYHHRIGLPHGFTIGSRWASPRDGYVPIGFFQLWHSSGDEWQGIRIKPYPADHGNACRTDVQHGLQWDRRKRVLIPELLAIHLESESAKTGANWNGRTTKRFGPEASHERPAGY